MVSQTKLNMALGRVLLTYDCSLPAFRPNSVMSHAVLLTYNDCITVVSYCTPSFNPMHRPQSIMPHHIRIVLPSYHVFAMCSPCVLHMFRVLSQSLAGPLRAPPYFVLHYPPTVASLSHVFPRVPFTAPLPVMAASYELCDVLRSTALLL